MSPIQMLANFIANMQTELRLVVSALAVCAVIYLAGKAIYDSQHQQQGGGRVNVGGLIGGLVGVALLWFIAFNARDILCWVITKMGQSCPT